VPCARSLQAILISSTLFDRLARCTPSLAVCLGLYAASCRSAPTNLPEAPEVVNSRVIFAPQCGRVFFSSNRDGTIGPFEIAVAAAPPTVSRIAVPHDRDLILRSVSSDCSKFALVGDHGGNGIFDVYLFDLTRRTFDALTHAHGENSGEPQFSPHRPVLAYLDEGRLKLYDCQARQTLLSAPSPVEFTSLVWSTDGGSVFLEDQSTDLWQYRPGDRGFRKVWQAPQRAYSPRLGYSSGRSLYFLSDHEGGVSQVYRLDLESSHLQRVAPSSHDQYSPLERPDGLFFRTSVDGNFMALRLRAGRVDTLSPRRGVVYDFSLDFPKPLFVYAGAQEVTSIYAVEPDGSWTDLLSPHPAVVQPAAREFRTADGMVHFVFALDSQPQHWIVWLHGGPREQVSPRFNLYFDYLTRLGYAILALNYPGSTGIGNMYELAGVPDTTRVERQLAGIDDALTRARELYPHLDRYVLVGVSYGSAVGFLHLLRHPKQVTKFIDFSGVTTRPTQPELSDIPTALPPILSIHGANDPHQKTPARRALLKARGRLARTTDVVLNDEGHYIGRRQSIRIILGQMRQFLAPASP
jgi:pimeloyl-ACP methyl ester carboxylesterase